MKGLTGTLKRFLAVVFTLTLVLSSFFFTDLGFGFDSLKAQAIANVSSTSNIPLDIYVPESVLLDADGNFVCFVNDTELFEGPLLLNGGAVESSASNTGRVAAYCGDSSVTNLTLVSFGRVDSGSVSASLNSTSLSKSMSMPLTISLSSDEVTQYSLTGSMVADPGSKTLIEWVFRFKLNNSLDYHYAYRYTVIYKPMTVSRTCTVGCYNSAEEGLFTSGYSYACLNLTLGGYDSSGGFTGTSDPPNAGKGTDNQYKTIEWAPTC